MIHKGHTRSLGVIAGEINFKILFLPMKSFLTMILIEHFDTGGVRYIIRNFIDPFDMREHLVALFLFHHWRALVPQDLFIRVNAYYELLTPFLCL
jgi:hypothetical protein